MNGQIAKELTLIGAIFSALLSMLLGCSTGPVFEVSDLVVTPTEVLPGQTVEACVMVTNSGDREGTYEATFRIDASPKEVRELTLVPASSETVCVQITEQLGTHTVTVEQLAAKFEVVRDTTPPETAIMSGPTGDIDYDDVLFRWAGSDDHSRESELTYSYYLEEHEHDYTPFSSETSRSYADLAEGSYVFHVRARDREGNVDPTPATSEFTITFPADIIMPRAGYAEGEKIFELETPIPLPAYKTVLMYVPKPVSTIPGIHCSIENLTCYWDEYPEGKYIVAFSAKYRITVRPGVTPGVYDLLHKYYIYPGSAGGNEIGTFDFKLKVKIPSG